jgi:hypothetical protein
MASTTAPTGPFRAPLTPPLRQLWQVPTFLLGLLAIAAVCAVRPPWHMSHGPADPPALAELRELLKQTDFDRDRALKLGAEAVHGAGTPAASAEAHFLLGSVYAVLADQAGPGKASDQWREARANLEQARMIGVAEEDRPRLDYRLAKAWAQTGEAPAKVIAALVSSIDDGARDDLADAARGYGMLAEAYLKLPKPDLAASLAVTEKQIDQPVVSPDLLAPARLRRGELLARLNRLDEADDVLKKIMAPVAVAAQARRLRVRLLEHTERWAEAAPIWREILDDRTSPPQDRQTVLYHLGLCQCNAGRKEEALSVWEDCLRTDGPGEEGSAAALGIAELRARERQFEPALAALERAVREVKEPGQWHNSLIALAGAREVFEAACKGATAAGAFEASMKAAQLYERLALPGRAHELRAEAAVAAAGAAREKVRGAPAEEQPGLYLEEESQLCEAGEAYQKAAEAQTDPVERAERLWSAANRFYDGRDTRRAAAAFVQFLKIAEQPDQLSARRFIARLNEAWYKAGKAYQTAYPDDAEKMKEASAYFDKAATSLEGNSPYVYRARYEYALTKRIPDVNGGWRWTDDAEAILEKNLTQLRTNPDRDEEARENTLYALGYLYFDRREQRDSITRAIETLEEALRFFQSNPQSLVARYQLAESYRLRADQRSVSLGQERLTVDARLEIEKKVMDDREKAITNYLELSKALEAMTDRKEPDEHYLVYALSAAADVRYLSGGYVKSAEMYQTLIERIKDKKGYEIDYLSALANQARAWMSAMLVYSPTDADYQIKMQEARRNMRRALDGVRGGLPRLDREARQSFEKWLQAFDPPAR